MGKYIEQINNSYHLTVGEVQFDCDWSLSSKERYFAFLEHFRGLYPYRLSATIRLHQVKYQDTTGVPPIDRGVLMYYNMGKITATGSNSIYDREVAKRYLPSLRGYPLPLDLALPLFSWGVHSIAGDVNALIGGLTTAQMDTIKGVERMGETSSYLVTHQTNYLGRLWQKGDVIKVEEITPENLREMKADLIKYMKQPPKEIILYDLNKNITTYEKKLFEDLR